MSGNSTGFTYAAHEKHCPCCGDLLHLTRDHNFCGREHGGCMPVVSDLPVATRTAKNARFTIAGTEGFWRIPSHVHKDMPHDGPPEGAIVASLVRYKSSIPTAVAFIRAKPRRKSSR